MKKIRQSFSVRLALRFMFLLTVAIIILSFAFLFLVRSIVNLNKTEELKNAEQKVFLAMCFQKSSGYLAGAEIPYYITYIAYDIETQDILATNDPFLPFLTVTDGKAVRHFEKDFFFDGDLDILYYADFHEFDDRHIVVAVAINMDNNRICLLFHFRQIDIAGMVSLVVTGIVDILP